MAEAKTAFHRATGRRKTAVARVRIYENGTGKFLINGRELENFFTEDKDRHFILGPLLLTEMRTRVDVQASVRGGGYTGQAGAISQAVARALKEMFSPKAEADSEAGGIVKKLRDSGYLTRDGRMKERKKYGRKGARKSFQFSKR